MAYCSAVAAVATSNVSTGVGGPGIATLDGIALPNPSRILLTKQTNPVQNGVWTWTGSAVQLTRPTAATDPFKTGAILDDATVVPVAAGGQTWGGSRWWVNTPATGAITVDTTSITVIRENAKTVQARVASTANITLTSPGPFVDSRTVTDGAMTTGGSSTTLTCGSSQPFTVADVGRTIQVNGAGVAGANLTTTIASYTSSSVVLLTTGCSTTITGQTVQWGITLNVGDVVLLLGQTSGNGAKDNGLYFWNGSASAMTRTADPLYPAIEVQVSEGAFLAHAHYKLTNQGTIVVGSSGTALDFVRQNVLSAVIPGVYNIQDFGAIGDNVTDNSVAGPGGSDALNNAILAAGIGGAIFVPPGIYRHSKPLKFSAAAGTIGVRMYSTSRGQDGNWQASFVFVGTPLSGTKGAITSISPGTPSPGSLDIMSISLDPLTQLTTANIGDTITLSGCMHAGNNCSMTIVTVPSSTSCTAYANNLDEFFVTTQCLGTDMNNLHINWTVRPPQVRLYSRGCTFENLSFQGQGNAGCIFDGAPDSSGIINTQNHFYDCQIAGGAPLVSTTYSAYGIKIGDIGQNGGMYGGNCEAYTIVDCYFQFFSHSCINIPNNTGNSKSHWIDKALFNNAGGLNTALYGIWVNRGSFLMKGTLGEFIGILGGTGNAGALIMLFGNFEPVSIQDTNFEHCVRFMRAAQGGSSPQSIHVDGVRMGNNPGETASDGFMGLFSGVTGLTIEHADFNGAINPSQNISLLISGSDISQPIAASIRYCSFNRADAHIVQTGASGNCYESIGNTWGSNSMFSRVPDGILRAWRTDNAQFVPYPAVAWHTQATALDEFNTFDAWSGSVLVNGANNNLPALPNTNVVIANSSGVVTGPWSISGVVADTENPAGRVYKFTNEVGFPLTLTHNGSGSSAGNRIFSPTGADLVNVYAWEMIYLTTATVATAGWYILSFTLPGGGSRLTATVSVSSGATLSPAQWSAESLVFTGTLTANQTVVIPAIKGWACDISLQCVFNGHTLTFSTPGGAATMAYTNSGAPGVRVFVTDSLGISRIGG
jgi:hypothetical protein